MLTNIEDIKKVTDEPIVEASPSQECESFPPVSIVETQFDGNNNSGSEDIHKSFENKEEKNSTEEQLHTKEDIKHNLPCIEEKYKDHIGSQKIINTLKPDNDTLKEKVKIIE